jgi:predicted TIM-barrel fold metal-dependent hydrolase
MSGHATSSGREIRATLDHPVVDADAHIVECGFVADDYVREIGGPEIFKRWMNRPPNNGVSKQMWWGQPSGAHTADRAMSILPKYFATRMDDCGIDFAHMLSTLGIPSLYIRDHEVRQVAARALNTMFADIFRDVSDRIRPVALIPTFTPDEAIRELEYAVLELGHKAIMIGTEIRLPCIEVATRSPELSPYAERWQSIAIDAPHDYDPFWQRCVDLKVAPLCHTSLMGAQHRRSPNNYVFNHLGMFAQGSEHFCRALFMGGVTKRFPTLNFGLLEGGVAWAATLLNDIVEHFEKRNVDNLLENLDPAKIDMELFEQLFEQFGDARHTAARIREDPFRASDRKRPAVFDEFGACGMKEIDDLRTLFCRNFYFGCEADDRMMSVAFNRRLNPLGMKLKATFGSDIGHWDVMDATTILGEAYGLVEAGLITRDDFRDFTWTNPVSLHLGMNPDYFKGTTVEAQAARLLPALDRTPAAPAGRAV